MHILFGQLEVAFNVMINIVSILREKKAVTIKGV